MIYDFNTHLQNCHCSHEVSNCNKPCSLIDQPKIQFLNHYIMPGKEHMDPKKSFRTTEFDHNIQRTMFLKPLFSSQHMGIRQAADVTHDGLFN